VTLLYLNDLDGAIERYARGLELAPNDPQRAVELAMLLRERGRGDDLEQAWELAARAAEAAPNAPSVLACRAELFAAVGDVKRAVALYGEAIRALPPGAPQRSIYEQRARALGR
jgi:tetratricopeptide (TPR) repeat protein